MNNAFFRTENGDIVDLCKIIKLERYKDAYRIFLPSDVYLDITKEDYIRINNYLARWNNSTYFKLL